MFICDYRYLVFGDFFIDLVLFYFKVNSSLEVSSRDIEVGLVIFCINLIYFFFLVR